MIPSPFPTMPICGRLKSTIVAAGLKLGPLRLPLPLTGRVGYLDFTYQDEDIRVTRGNRYVYNSTFVWSYSLARPLFFLPLPRLRKHAGVTEPSGFWFCWQPRLQPAVHVCVCVCVCVQQECRSSSPIFVWSTVISSHSKLRDIKIPVHYAKKTTCFVLFFFFHDPRHSASGDIMGISPP